MYVKFGLYTNSQGSMYDWIGFRQGPRFKHKGEQKGELCAYWEYLGEICIHENY